ncbi:MAG: chorismate mutase [Oceanicaulis sp.]|uniref:bifunctional chorismate mutase/prephenate dehydratase n=1 Tax=unclassified Oceanicaulis TaxID=2632123 RepID=UPI000066D3AE|nr:MULTISPECIES: bifunctional chorismate mutase/prephenate dehydratase [unclassified Oceanicaulis]EAP91097.1 bifunctional chorismate mutase P/prephenate dehydratase [Oceanicaulis sp. HTCC2633]MBC39278.1 chorismate mutase [Oceanicaulis sp.]MBG34483.1 chorismate mutase [Oceanicaulis sp.]HBU62937.1 bifunctional chorismate mutase/prephenate dehydratase [Oceanicaulis sp.]
MSPTKTHDERQILRQAIDATDSEILKTLAERRRLVEALVALKAGDQSPVRDTDRERAVIERAVAKGRELGLADSFVETLFQAIIDDSLRRQRASLDARAGDVMLTEARVAYLGGPGSYSQFAANAHFSGRYSGVAPVIKRDYAAIFKALEDGEADYGFLPIENTATGGVNEVYDLLRDSNLKIAGEHHMKIQHALMGKATDLGPVRTVYGHPQALRQAQRWLNARTDLKKIPVTSTTRALERALDEGPAVAAVAGPDAARLFGLNLIEPNISDFEGNETRFVALAVDPAPASPLLPCKTSLVFITSDASGSLVDALDGFRQHGVNMTKLESRPVHGAPWEQMFFLDLEGHEEDKAVAKALEHLAGHAKSVRRFGSYGSDRLKPTQLEG